MHEMPPQSSDGQPLETEVKLHVPNLDAVAERIRAAGGQLLQPRTFERNVRYDTPEHTLSAQRIVLRLRQDERVRLTYKDAATLHDGALSRVELEVTLDDFATMDAILQKLGFFPSVRYEKYRTTYRLGAAEIMLDEMPFGHFVEIEGPLEAIQAAQHTLALTDRPRLPLSYLALFEHVKAALKLQMHDLTFAAFADVHVPPALFERLGERFPPSSGHR